MGTTSIQPGGGAIGQKALQGQTGAAGALTGQGGSLFGQGQGQLQQSGRYFSTLASGNRAAAGQVLKPEIQSVNDVYGGTARTLSRFLRGPEKDVQMAEGERERAGAVSNLFSSARPAANNALAAMGAGSTSMGLGATAAGGSQFGGVARTSQDAAVESAKLEQQQWQGFGNLLGKFLPFLPGFRGGGGGGG